MKCLKVKSFRTLGLPGILATICLYSQVGFSVELEEIIVTAAVLAGAVRP